MLGPIGQEDALQPSDHEITGSIPDTVKYSVILKKRKRKLFNTTHTAHVRDIGNITWKLLGKHPRRPYNCVDPIYIQCRITYLLFGGYSLHKSENKFGLHKSENKFGLHKSEKIVIIFVVWLGRFVPFAK